MIRLGSLAGYPFEGPRLLAGWTAPASAAVYVVLCRPEPDKSPERYAVIYVGHADDLSTIGFPFRHTQADCWVRRAGDRWSVHIATYEVPGGLRSHREQIAQELTAVYKPGCNERQVDRSWKPRVDRRVLRAHGRTSDDRHRPRPRPLVDETRSDLRQPGAATPTPTSAEFLRAQETWCCSCSCHDDTSGALDLSGSRERWLIDWVAPRALSRSAHGRVPRA